MILTCCGLPQIDDWAVITEMDNWCINIDDDWPTINVRLNGEEESAKRGACFLCARIKLELQLANKERRGKNKAADRGWRGVVMRARGGGSFMRLSGDGDAAGLRAPRAEWVPCACTKLWCLRGLGIRGEKKEHGQ
jgi:hypothetical protein